MLMASQTVKNRNPVVEEQDGPVLNRVFSPLFEVAARFWGPEVEKSLSLWPRFFYSAHIVTILVFVTRSLEPPGALSLETDSY